MRKSKSTPVFKERSSAEPDLQLLREEFRWATDQRDSNILARQRLNIDTRNCRWPNQSVDGRKWSARKGEDVFPFEGASDSRPALVDMFINEDVAKLMVIWRRNKILVSGTESNDTAFATRLTQVLRWMKYTQMRESRREMALLANYFLERGSAVLGVFWDKREQLGYDELDMETIVTMAMEVQKDPNQAPPGLDPDEALELPALIFDPSSEDRAAEIGSRLYPDVKKSRLLQVVRDLRNTGRARFPRPYTVKDRPCIVALAPNEDIFLPPETTDLQSARVIFRREMISETELIERERSYGWDAKWIQMMIETQKGKTDASALSNAGRRGASNSRGELRSKNLFEVIHSYQRLHDSDGVPGIYYTCHNLRIGDAYAAHGLLDYDHGEQPFVLFERETRGRLIDDSRGLGECLSTHQSQIKGEWDSRMDANSLKTLPPSYYPIGGKPDAWGPGVRIPTDRPADYGFFDGPDLNPGSIEMENTVFNFARRYVGRAVGEDNLLEAQAMSQAMAENWMGSCADADTQMLQLMQQFMPDKFFYRVVGSGKGQAIHASREDIQGEFDVQIGYNIADLDPEMVAEKMGLIEKVLSMDMGGVIDRAEAVTVAFELVDPNLGERLIRPSEEASQSEVDDEKNVYSQIFAGLAVDVKPSGQAYNLRLKTLQEILTNSPTAQQRYQQDEEFKANVDKRVKQLMHQVEQKQVNAKIGVLGA